jgi:hypothetical protein
MTNRQGDQRIVHVLADGVVGIDMLQVTAAAVFERADALFDSHRRRPGCLAVFWYGHDGDRWNLYRMWTAEQ